ncbi:MAG: hypothetical protein ACRCX8_08780 [Sarcina sp.]
MSKGYSTYHLEVKYLNGDVENLKINGIHKEGNRKETLDFYNDVKEQYINDKNVASIECIGTNPEGKTWVFFTKEVNTVQEQSTEDFIKNNLEKDVRNVVQEIVQRVDLLQTQKEVLFDKIKIAEKKRDTLLHKVGMIKNNKFATKQDEINYRLNMLEEIELNEDERRKIKLNYADINNIIGKVKDIPYSLETFCKDRKAFTMTPEEYEEKVEKVIKYRTDKERIHFMTQFQNKYDRVVNDPIKKELFFYNYVGQGKRKIKKAI